ncbi:alpha/beta hydrolase [[Mycobacterium] nativiensis]|uniref:Alpha/beta hydrolase fold domain-containing protein n=1 Tax=[Mycobacterium] nativiensis TaxID=2855503 RepID=A0ABU5XS94_9MYCO|nr:alpha/beta hydrolase fold domain-containing protein [Mycolicibacter sp. MYC340]MEB3030842.1 alpha/beta hydrolase fold domain-containing protein [Mycolicibacter sp. MYC340]
MSGVGPVRRASLLARIIYVVFAAVMPRLVRWISRRGGPEAMPGVLTKLGRRTNTVARLQRLRPFFGIRFTRESAAGVPVEVVRRKDCDAPLSDGVILYFHGGGFFTGGLDTHLHVVATLARRTRLPVIHVDYQQFPEVTVDGSVADCVTTYRWLLDQGADPAKTVIAGDSAGGFLTFATALAAQQDGLPSPAGVIGISALLELDGAARSIHPNMATDAFGIADALPDLVDQVCPSLPMRHELSPINGRLETMPPALMIAAESEILRCDNERLHAALLTHNRSSRLELWASQVHAFPALFPFLSESRAAFEMMTRFVADRLADADRPDETRREVS